MFEAIGRILDSKLKVSQGIVKQRKKYRNTYDPENLDYEYIEKQDKADNRDTTFYLSENQNLQLLNANYVKNNTTNDTPTKLHIKELDVIIEMVLQNKKTDDIIGIISRVTSKNAFDSLFILFALNRKYMLINYLFTQCKKFEFFYPLFIMCLEND